MFILALSQNSTKMLRNKNKAREEKGIGGQNQIGNIKMLGLKSDKQVLFDLSGQRNLSSEPRLGGGVAGSRL